MSFLSIYTYSKRYNIISQGATVLLLHRLCSSQNTDSNSSLSCRCQPGYHIGLLPRFSVTWIHANAYCILRMNSIGVLQKVSKTYILTWTVVLGLLLLCTGNAVTTSIILRTWNPSWQNGTIGLQIPPQMNNTFYEVHVVEFLHHHVGYGMLQQVVIYPMKSCEYLRRERVLCILF